MSKSPHVDKAKKYARDVASGKIDACKYVILAAQRFLDELDAAKAADYPYRFIRGDVEHFCNFMESLPHVKGHWAVGDRNDPKSTLLHMEPFQCFIAASIFGWRRKDDDTRRIRQVYIEEPRKNGKALEISTPIPTPRGWKAHGDLLVGDYVFGPNGEPVRVNGVTEHYIGPCMTLKLSDGSAIVAHEKHEWATERTWYTKRKRGFRDNRPLPLLETKEIADTLRGGTRGDFVHRIKNCGALKLPEAKLLVPPYTFGVWLGDGTTRSAVITVADREILDHITFEGIPLKRHKGNGHGAASSYGLTNGDRAQVARDTCVQARLGMLGVLGNKHIPLQYLRGSVEQRYELLRGIIDSDGHITERGQVEITLTCHRLVKDVIALIRTLGIKATCSESKATLYGKDCGPRWRISFFPADETRLAYVRRKFERQKILGVGKRRSDSRTVISAEPAGDKTVNCISVEGGFYIAGDGLVTTHNSVMAAVIGLYMFAADNEFGAEVYSGATSEKQAWEVFRPAKLMAQRTAEFRDAFGVEVNAKNMNIIENGSRFEPVIGKPGDGASPHMAIIDEYHEHQTDELHDTMMTGMGARRQPLLFVITTAGADIAGPCYAMRSDVVKVLEGTVENDRLFALIYGIDEGDDWTDPKMLRKANPNYDVSVSGDYLLAQQKDAMTSPRKQNVFLTKHLNVWVHSRSPWMNMLAWDNAADPELKITDFMDDIAWAGADVSAKRDLTSWVRVFKKLVDGEIHYYVFGEHWLPEDAAIDPNKPHYAEWMNSGALHATPGTILDLDEIEVAIQEAAESHQIADIGFDPWGAYSLMGSLQSGKSGRSLTVTEVPQTVKYLSDPMKWLAALVDAGRVHHNGDPVLSWCVSNVTVREDANENIFPRKERPDQKIDAAVAMIIAFNRALTVDEPGSSVYATRGLLVLGAEETGE